MRWSSDVRLDGGPAPDVRESPQAPEPDHTTRADKLPSTPAVETPRASARRDSVVRAPRLARETARRQAARARARRDSTRATQVGIARASRDSMRIAMASAAPAGTRDSTSRASASASASASHAGPPSPPETTRVVNAPAGSPNAPRALGAPSPAAETPDTCACRLRGTVEIDWDRPLDRNFPVELTLEGPALQSTQVDMFMGSPREFRFGPLPCGDYRLTVATSGRWHFTFERGDTVLAVPCRGSAQKRVILAPAKR